MLLGAALLSQQAQCQVRTLVLPILQMRKWGQKGDSTKVSQWEGIELGLTPQFEGPGAPCFLPILRGQEGRQAEWGPRPCSLWREEPHGPPTSGHSRGQRPSLWHSP